MQRCIRSARSAAGPCPLTARQPRLRGCNRRGGSALKEQNPETQRAGQVRRLGRREVQCSAAPRLRDRGLRAGSEARERAEPQPQTATGLGPGSKGRGGSGLLVQMQQVCGAAGGVVGCRLRFLVASRRRRRRRNKLVHARGNGNAHHDSRRRNNAGSRDENHAAARRPTASMRAKRSVRRNSGLGVQASRTAARVREAPECAGATRLSPPRRLRREARARRDQLEPVQLLAFAPVLALYTAAGQPCGST